MDWQTLGAFLIATAIVLATPGPVMAILVGNTVHGGHHMGLRTVIGIGLGEVMLVSLLAVSFLISSRFFEDLFPWLSLASALYLVWLAANTVLRASPPVHAQMVKLSSRPFVDGLAVTVSNPTALLFYSAFFLPFAVQSDSPVVQFGVLAVLYVPLSIAADLICVIFVARLSGRGRYNPTFARIARMLSAIVYLATSALAIASFLGTTAP